jgi:hypothetical protein
MMLWTLSYLHLPFSSRLCDIWRNSLVKTFFHILLLHLPGHWFVARGNLFRRLNFMHILWPHSSSAPSLCLKAKLWIVFL